MYIITYLRNCTRWHVNVFLVSSLVCVEYVFYPPPFLHIPTYQKKHFTPHMEGYSVSGGLDRHHYAFEMTNQNNRSDGRMSFSGLWKKRIRGLREYSLRPCHCHGFLENITCATPCGTVGHSTRTPPHTHNIRNCGSTNRWTTTTTFLSRDPRSLLHRLAEQVKERKTLNFVSRFHFLVFFSYSFFCVCVCSTLLLSSPKK